MGHPCRGRSCAELPRAMVAKTEDTQVVVVAGSAERSRQDVIDLERSRVRARQYAAAIALEDAGSYPLPLPAARRKLRLLHVAVCLLVQRTPRTATDQHWAFDTSPHSSPRLA